MQWYVVLVVSTLYGLAGTRRCLLATCTYDVYVVTLLAKDALTMLL